MAIRTSPSVLRTVRLCSTLPSIWSVGGAVQLATPTTLRMPSRFWNPPPRRPPGPSLRGYLHGSGTNPHHVVNCSVLLHCLNQPRPPPSGMASDSSSWIKLKWLNIEGAWFGGSIKIMHHPYCNTALSLDSINQNPQISIV